MKYNTRFDLDAILNVLRTVNERFQEGSPEDEALRIAAVSLIYVRETQKLDDYREFFRSFFTPAIDDIVIAQVFATKEEAEAWLAGDGPKEGDLVSVSGEGFQVIPARKGRGWMFLRTPLPEELMKLDAPGSK